MTKPADTSTDAPASTSPIVDVVLKARRSTLANEVQAVLTAKGWSLQQAEIQTGIPASTIGRLKAGANVKPDTILLFAKKAGLDMERWNRIAAGLPLEESDPLSKIGIDVNVSAIREIPHIRGYASADTAQSTTALGEVEGTLGDKMPDRFRSIEVRGDCMEPYYRSGDVLIVREQEIAFPGEKVIALVDGQDLTCKVFRMNGKPWLEPTNGEGKITADRFRILGVVDALFRPERVTNRVVFPS